MVKNRLKNGPQKTTKNDPKIDVFLLFSEKTEKLWEFVGKRVQIWTKFKKVRYKWSLLWESRKTSPSQGVILPFFAKNRFSLFLIDFESDFGPFFDHFLESQKYRFFIDF